MCCVVLYIEETMPTSPNDIQISFAIADASGNLPVPSTVVIPAAISQLMQTTLPININSVYGYHDWIR